MRVPGTSVTTACLWISISTLKAFRGFGQHHVCSFLSRHTDAQGVGNIPNISRIGFDGVGRFRTAFMIHDCFRHMQARG